MRDSSSGDKLKIALFGDLSLEEAMDLSRDRQMLEPHLHLVPRLRVNSAISLLIEQVVVSVRLHTRIRAVLDSYLGLGTG
jgi:hypothetical protein